MARTPKGDPALRVPAHVKPSQLRWRGKAHTENAGDPGLVTIDFGEDGPTGKLPAVLSSGFHTQRLIYNRSADVIEFELAKYRGNRLLFRPSILAVDGSEFARKALLFVKNRVQVFANNYEYLSSEYTHFIVNIKNASVEAMFGVDYANKEIALTCFDDLNDVFGLSKADIKKEKHLQLIENLIERYYLEEGPPDRRITRRFLQTVGIADEAITRLESLATANDQSLAGFVSETLNAAAHAAPAAEAAPPAKGIPGVASALPRVSESPEFQEHARANQWNDRRERGYGWKANVFEFIRDTYEPWLGKGMMQSDLKDVDPPLYNALRNRLYTQRKLNPDVDPMPEWLDLPTERGGGDLRLIADPDERRMVEARRAFFREKNAAFRGPSPLDD